MERDEMQEAVVKMYVRENPYRSTLLLGTGFGKAKTAIDIITTVMPEKVLIVVNSTDLRDKTWKHEFAKWGESEFYDKYVSTVTYQKLYKDPKVKSNYLIVADEVDFAGSTEKLSAFMDVVSDCKVLGLTGFITESKRWWFDKHLPIIKEYSTNDAIEDKILNGIHFVFVKYEIGRERTVEVKYTKDGFDRSFMSSENSTYDFAENAVLSAQINVQTIASNVMLPNRERDLQLLSAEMILKYKIQARARILADLDSSKKLAKLYIDEYKESDSKVVVFCSRTEQADAINKNSYHGKNTSDVNESRMKKFISGSNRVLTVCSKINRGANIPGLNIAIFESFNSSDTEANQRLGRMTRLGVGRTARVYIFLPHYYKFDKKTNTNSLRETRQVAWARTMLGSVAIKSHETINLLLNDVTKSD